MLMTDQTRGSGASFGGVGGDAGWVVGMFSTFSLRTSLTHSQAQPLRLSEAIALFYTNSEDGFRWLSGNVYKVTPAGHSLVSPSPGLQSPSHLQTTPCQPPIWSTKPLPPAGHSLRPLPLKGSTWVSIRAARSSQSAQRL